MAPKRPGPIKSIRSLFRLMATRPVREVEVPLDFESIRIQQRGTGKSAEYCLRIGTRSDAHYVPMTPAQMADLSSKIREFIEGGT